MKAIRWRSSARRRVPFGCEPLEARLQFAGDLTFDTSFSPDLQAALDHAIIAKGNTTAHLASSGLGLVLELTGGSGTLLSVAADGIPATITGMKVLDAGQFSISGSRTFSFLNLRGIAQARVAGVQVQYSLYADNVGELQADARQLPVTVAGSTPTVFYSASFDHATVLSSNASLTLVAPAPVSALSLVLLESNARVNLGFKTSELSIYGGVTAQVDQTNSYYKYTPRLLTALTAPPDAGPAAKLPDPVIPPVSVPEAPAVGTNAPAAVAEVPKTTLPAPVSDPLVATPAVVVPPLSPVETAPEPVATPPVAVIPPLETTVPVPVASAPPPAAVATPPAPPAVSPARGETAVPDSLRALVYLASLNLISFDDQIQTRVSLLLGRAVAGLSEAAIIRTNPAVLDSLDHRRDAEPPLRDGLASHQSASSEEAVPFPPLTLNVRLARERQLDFAFLPAVVAKGGDRAAGDPVSLTKHALRLPVLRPAGAEDAGQPPRLFNGETSSAALVSPAASLLPIVPLQALGSLLADRLEAELTPGERTAVLISETRRAGSSFHE